MTTQEPQSMKRNMGAMTVAQRQRYDEISSQLRAAANQIEELPDGYAFRYPPNSALFLERKVAAG